MRRIASAVASIGACVLAAAAGASTPPDLPRLVRIASEATGLTPTRPVRAEVVSPTALEKRALVLLDRRYPRERQQYDERLYRALGLLGRDETLRPHLLRGTRGVLSVFDGQSLRTYVRASPQMTTTLLREIVKTLHAQRFNLKKAASLRVADRDADSAASAAIEGSATLVAEHVAPRRLAQARASHFGYFYELQSAFAYSTGLRFAATLQNVGGRAAVQAALRSLPASSEQIFHVDAYLSREQPKPIELPERIGELALTGTDTWGELDVRALLAVFQIPRLDRVGTGWGAGLSALYGNGAESVAALRLDWDTELDARQWAEAAGLYVNEAFDASEPGLPVQEPCEATACWRLGDRAIAFHRIGTRSALVLGSAGSDIAAYATALVPR